MRETRMAPGGLEFRAKENGGGVLTGYAAVFGRMSQDLGGFVEQVLPGAFAKTIQESDVRALINHSPMHVLGRNKAGTLRLAEDSTGLHYEVDTPNRQDARDLAASVERGDVSGSSFTFETVGPEGDSWTLTDQDYPLRSLVQVRLYDVGPVTYPAYLSTEEAQTQVALRSLEAVTGASLADIAAAAEAHRLTDLLKGQEGRDGAGADLHSDEAARLALQRQRLLLESLRHPGAE